MGHLFISYKSDERELAESVREKLLAWGYQTWMDIHNIPPTADWMDEIGKALESADRVIGVMTPAALASYPVRREWETAIAKNKFLPLRFKECPPHWLFDGIQRIDFARSLHETAFKRCTNGSKSQRLPSRIVVTLNRSMIICKPFLIPLIGN